MIEIWMKSHLGSDNNCNIAYLYAQIALTMNEK